MENELNNVCDDFYVNMRLGTQMGLSHGRETLLHFFEQIQKAFPEMTRFRKGEGNEYTLEEDRERDAYRWLSIESARLSAGHVNPPDIAEAMKLHRAILDHAPYALNLSMIEIDHLDLLFGFDLEYAGNHDEIIAECMLGDSPLGGLIDEPGVRAVDVQPTITVSLSEDCRLQARVDIVTRTNSHQIRSGEFSSEVISVYLIIRRYWGDRMKQSMDEMLNDMAHRAEELAHRFVVPKIVQPIRAAIGTRP